MYYVQYRCLYREHWYEDSTPLSYQAALVYSQRVANQRGTVTRVVDDYGRVVG